MSVVIATLIFCDGKTPACIETGSYAGGDARLLPAKRQRAQYVADGWRYLRGKDYCPNCLEHLGLGGKQ